MAFFFATSSTCSHIRLIAPVLEVYLGIPQKNIKIAPNKLKQSPTVFNFTTESLGDIKKIIIKPRHKTTIL